MPTVTPSAAHAAIIRPASAADAPAIYTIEQQSFKTDGFQLRQFQAALKHGQNVFLVAEFDHNMTGYIWVLLHQGRPQMGRIYSIAVSPDHQGKGIAAQLLAEAIKRLERAGLTELRLEVRQDNAHAQQFYTHKGFTPFATAPNYYADGMAALKMRKQLTPQT